MCGERWGMRRAMSNDDIRATWHYQNGTKHPAGRLMDPQHVYDRTRRPLAFKIYKDLPLIPLPLDTAGSLPALRAISGDASAGADAPGLDVAAMARLLYFSTGITKYLEQPAPIGRM